MVKLKKATAGRRVGRRILRLRDATGAWNHGIKNWIWRAAVLVVFAGWIAGQAAAENWPTFRYDNGNRGASPESIQTPLHLQWTYTPKHKPRPAWPEPCKEVSRTAFDYAPQVAVAHGLLFFGSSADHKLYALDLRTGREQWSFFTEGPIRFAPAVAGDRLFVASDDGRLYCLSAREGQVLWRFHGGPADERLMGNQQLISRWPARSGVLVDGDTVYFSVGMWQPDDVYVYSLDAANGTIRWENNTSGQRYMGLPHSSMEGIAGVAPQGQLALDGHTLLVPGGRMMPAGFDCRSGQLLFCDNGSDKLHHAGGSCIAAASGFVWGGRRPVQGHPHVKLDEAEPPPGSGLLAWDCRSGEQRLALVGKHRAVIDENVMYATGDGEIVAIDLETLKQRGRDYYGTGQVDPEIPKKHIGPMRYWRGAGYPWGPWKVVPVSDRPARRWTSEVGRTYELVLGGNTLFAGGRETVTAFSAKSGEQTWQTAIDGDARGLAIADGRLLVSSTTGDIHCYGPARTPQPSRVQPDNVEPKVTRKTREEAKRILEQSEVAAGYCLLIGAGDGTLAYELARQSELTVYCLEPDVKKLESARALLDAAGVYGGRVVVHQGRFKKLAYANYLFDLILLNRCDTSVLNRCSASEIYRVLQPCGGVLQMIPASCQRSTVQQWLLDADIPAEEIELRERSVRVERGDLPGAAEWTHKYCDASRPGASTDQHVRPPLKMLWFGKPGPARIISRHWRTPAPLFIDGRMFISGEHHLMAVDAYNGRIIWTRELPGVGRFPAKYRGGQIVADREYVYATVGMKCHKLAAASGKIVQTYCVPESMRDVSVRSNPIHQALDAGGRRARPAENQIEWEYLAVTDGLVIGSVGQPNFSWTGWPEAHPECKYVFVLDKESGKLKWSYEAEESVLPEAICIVQGTLCLVDRTARATVERAKRRGKTIQTSKALKAFDLKAGELLWETNEGLRGRLLWSNGETLLVTHGRSSAYCASDGKLLWSKRIPGHQYPVIIGDTFYLYPGAYELRTGERRTRQHPLTNRPNGWRFAYKAGCGSFSGCPGALLCRSGAAGIYDLKNDSGMGWLGQVRPSCWVNMIAAGGMLLSPEGASSCSCPYNYLTSLAMVPDDRNEKWHVFPESGAAPGSRLRTLAVNFGAVGDRRDNEGALWTAFPRPFKPGALTVPLFAANIPDYYRANADETAMFGTHLPWLYTSGSKNLRRAELELFLKRPVPAPPCNDPPRIDGLLDDNCWDQRSRLMLTSDNQATDGKAIAYLRSDDNNLYVGFRRRAVIQDGRPVPWTSRSRGRDAKPWNDDSFGLRLWDAGKRTGVYMHVSSSGATFEGKTDNSMHGLIGSDESWNGVWKKAVKTEPRVWHAEIAVPWKTLKQAGMRRRSLAVYLESVNRTGVGPARRQYKYRTLRRLYLFKRMTPIVYRELPRHPVRSYDVTLHFAELKDIEPGERVFDVRLQGQTVIPGLDIREEAGGSHRPLAKTVRGVEARDKLELELVPHSDMPPVVSGLEVRYDEQEAKARVKESIDEDLVAHWRFDGENATIAKDSSGNDHTGRIVGAEKIQGKAGLALAFDGEDDYVNCGNPASFNMSDGLTVSAWINVASYHEDVYHDVVLSKGMGAYSIFLHRKSGGAIRGYFNLGNERQSLPIHAAHFGQWHHVAVTVRDGQQTAYYDGAAAGGRNHSGPLGNTKRNLLIGYSEDFAARGHFHGLIDEVRLYKRALAAEEIQWLFNMHKER